VYPIVTAVTVKLAKLDFIITTITSCHLAAV